MKKGLTVLVVLAVLCTSVFAANMSVRGHFSPLVMVGFGGSVQPFPQTFNFDGQFNYYVTENIRVGAKVDLLAFGFAGSNLTALYAKAGYVYPINDSWSVAADLGLGCALIGSDVASFAGDLELTGAYNFNKNLSIDFGAQVSCMVTDPVPYFGFGPIVGVEYKF